MSTRQKWSAAVQGRWRPGKHHVLFIHDPLYGREGWAKASLLLTETRWARRSEASAHPSRPYNKSCRVHSSSALGRRVSEPKKGIVATPSSGEQAMLSVAECHQPGKTSFNRVVGASKQRIRSGLGSCVTFLLLSCRHPYGRVTSACNDKQPLREGDRMLRPALT
jgi:hypothetical protein